MIQHKMPVDVAIAFSKAWTNHDLKTAAGYLAEGVVFDGPMQQSTGKQAYLDGLTKIAEDVQGMKLIAAYGDEEHALLFYDIYTKSWGTLTSAKYLTIQGGKIENDKLTFDSQPIRAAKPH